MAGRKQSEPVYEERDETSRKPAQICAAIAMFCCALVLGYIILAVPEPGTAMRAIQNVLFGMGGNLAIVIPAVFCWAGVLMTFAARGKRLIGWHVALDALLFLCLFASVHLFALEAIIRSMAYGLKGFVNYAAASFTFGRGGGLLGALLAVPLFNVVGKWGGLIVLLMVALLSLTLTGKAGRFVRWMREHTDTVRHNGEQRRTVREIEQMFDAAEPEPPIRRRMADPHNDELLSGRAGGANRRAGDRPRRTPAADREAIERMSSEYIENRERRAARRNPSARAGSGDGRAARNRAGAVPGRDAFNRIEAASGRDAFNRADAAPGRDAFNRAGAAPGRDAFNRAGAAPGSDTFNRAEAAPGSDAFNRTDAAPGRDTSARGSRSAGDARNRKADKPYTEPAMEDAFDDYDLMDAAAALDGRKKRDRAGFKPDTSESVEKIRKLKAKELQMSIDSEDLTIEPETCDVLEADEPPFDVPDRKGKPLPKLRRVQALPAEAEEEYNYPPIDLLTQGEIENTGNHRQQDLEKAQRLEDTLTSFGISSKLTGIAHGPAVTRFELQPAPGVKVSRIVSLADDIALNLAAVTVRIEAPIPGKAAVGVEIPNDKVEMVRLRDVLESSEARKNASKIAVGLGKDNSGRYIVADIAKMPHVLIAGQTGSGKSVCINSLIVSILFRASPDEVKLILIDPKVVELSIYNDIPHLICPVVTDPKKAASALDWAVAEMKMRYKKFSDRGVRDIKGYNKNLQPGEQMMPQIVIIIDELADLMMVAPGEAEDSICRLAQLARAAGMHLVIATQRPSVNVITGIIKANIPTRIAFSVASQVDSRTMIDHGGAEKLLGNGDMLFVPSGINKPIRVQGAWVSDEEVHAIVEYIKARSETTYDQDMIEKIENSVRSDAEREEFNAEYDELLPRAIEIVLEAGQASVSMLQRKMRVGYARAGRLVDEMEQRGIVSEADGAKPRSVLITQEQFQEMFED